MEKNTLVKTLSGVLVGGMLLSGGLAFADGTTNPVPDVKRPSIMGFVKHPGGLAGKQHFGLKGQKGFQENLDQFVKDGVISAEKGEKIKAFIEQKNKERQARIEELKKLSPEERKALKEKWRAEKFEKTPGNRQDLIDQLVESRIVTHKEADTLRAKMKEMAQKQNLQRIKDSLNVLVDNGTITAEQYDKILQQLEQSRKVPLNQMVSEGIITQEQADAVKKALFNHRGYKGGRR